MKYKHELDKVLRKNQSNW